MENVEVLFNSTKKVEMPAFVSFTVFDPSELEEPDSKSAFHRKRHECYWLI